MKKYWKDLGELTGQKEENKEVRPTEKDDASKIVSSRREFLKLMGVGIGSTALLNSCQKPIQKAIPHLVQPEEIIPGTPNYFATSYYADNKFCSIIAKVRDGRPIKIEGNTASPLTEGGTTAQVQASVMGLYDQVRYKKPMVNQKEADWGLVDKLTLRALEKQEGNKAIAFLTQSIISPSTQKVIEKFSKRYPQIDWIQYDTVSSSAQLKANDLDFNQRTIPLYHFDRADIVVGIDADFLGTWLAPALFGNQYAKQHNPIGGRLLRHYQFESGFSLTGAAADYRLSMEAGEEVEVLVSLYNLLAEELGETKFNHSGAISNPMLQQIVMELLEYRGRSVVVCGSQEVEIQRLCNRINVMLGNVGSTVDFSNAMLLKKGDDSNLLRFAEKLKAGEYSGVMFCDVNPVYNTPFGSEIAKAIPKLSFSLSFAESPNETSTLCKVVCPVPHYLESWNDANPFVDYYSITQPVIRHLFDSKEYQDKLLSWIGEENNWASFLKSTWKNDVFLMQSEFASFDSFWEEVMKKGYFIRQRDRYDNPNYTRQPINLKENKSSNGYRLKFYECVALGSGRYANNPILMELPDPISRVSWDNYASISFALAKKLKVEDEDTIKVGDLTLPVFVQPGQVENTISIAFGYGRSVCGKVGDDVGVNVFPLQRFEQEQRQTDLFDVKVEKDNEKYWLAKAQTHGDMEGRPIVRETTFAAYKKDAGAGNEFHKWAKKHKVTLYDEPKNPGHRWGMAVDLTKCIGCNNCAVSCQIENNVPVIGKEQVRNRRIMHWMRIDRYYNGSIEDPKVVFQPVMCQHCDNAPCENVCPVAATVHSNEGINQMAYNRCVGTRYCLNNCPYRVRRFNWFMYVENEKFDFVANNDLGRMVLNPDVTVRSRGVIEKCSFCVQRIQEAKLRAKKEGRPLRDGEIQPACVQSCPTKAIVFGDMNDKSSLIAKAAKDPRSYNLLEEIHTLPSISYLTKIRNLKE